MNNLLNALKNDHIALELKRHINNAQNQLLQDIKTYGNAEKANAYTNSEKDYYKYYHILTGYIMCKASDYGVNVFDGSCDTILTDFMEWDI